MWLWFSIRIETSDISNSLYVYLIGINILSESPWPPRQPQLIIITRYEVLNILRPWNQQTTFLALLPLSLYYFVFTNHQQKSAHNVIHIYIQLLFDSRKIPMSREKVLYQKYPKNTIHYFTIFLSCVLKKILLEEFDTQFERYCFKLLLCAFKHINRVFGKYDM